MNDIPLFSVRIEGVEQQVMVQVLRDGLAYYAKSFSRKFIDYGAPGSTPEEAVENYKEGLEAIIRIHLRTNGHVGEIGKLGDSYYTWSDTIVMDGKVYKLFPSKEALEKWRLMSI